MGFAIPSQVAKPVIESLMKYGKVEHARIGVSITDVTPENAKFFHLNEATGAVITQVESDSPGAKAGLKVGDVITKVNGQNVSDAGQLQVLIGQKRPGTKVDLGVIREGKEMTLPVTLEQVNETKMASNSGGEHGKARWGIGLDNLTPEIREEIQIPRDVRGAVITNVEPGSSADNAGLTQGMVIEEVNRHPVQSAADVQRELRDIPKGQDVMLLIWNNGGSTFAVLHAPEAGNS